METLASHYYAQLGIGGLARPMVVGDRLWLFSQTPAGPTPIQSIMLNGGATAAPTSNAALRSFGTAQMSSCSAHGNPAGSIINPMPAASVMESARNSILARGQPLNFAVAYAKPSAAATAYMPRLPMKPFGSFQDYNHLNGYRNPTEVSDAYLQLKYAALNSTNSTAENEVPAPNGLAELERVFGDSNVGFLESRQQHENGRLACNIRGGGTAGGDDGSDCSEIDCEQLDDNEE